jgi:dethiobiotin synthetase
MNGRPDKIRSVPLKGVPERAILITGTDTGAGKTYVACLLGKRLREAGIDARPLKPVESGCLPGPDGRPHPADAAALRDAVAPGLPLSEVCLYALAAPLSPHLAAEAEGVAVDPARVRRSVADAAGAADIVLVEGAGGIAVEIREGYSFADLARDLSLPVLVVAGNRLGVLNHLKVTIRYLESEGLRLLGVVLSDPSPDSFPAREPNEAAVRRIAGDRWLGRVPFGAAGLPDRIFSRFREFTHSR